MNTEPMPDILAQFQHNAKHIFRRLQVSSTGDAVPDGLDGADKVLVHNTRDIRSICIRPELKTIDPQHMPQCIRRSLCQIPDGVDSVLSQLIFCGFAHIQQLCSIKRPDYFFEVVPFDFGDCIRLSHV